MKPAPATAGQALQAVRQLRLLGSIDQQGGAGQHVSLTQQPVQGVHICIHRQPQHIVDDPRDGQLLNWPVSFQDLDRHRVAGGYAEDVGEHPRERETGGRQADRVAFAVDDPAQAGVWEDPR